MINDLLFILADVEIFGSDLFDKKDFIELLVRSAFNFSYCRLYRSISVLSSH